MPISYIQSNNAMMSLKHLLISSTVLSAAIFLKFSLPAVTEFAVYDVPSLYNGLVSWFRPPFLYLIINCIILTIVASTKLQSMNDDASPPQTIPIIGSVQPHPVEPLPHVSQEDYSVAESNDFSNHEMKMTEKGSDLEAYDRPDALRITKKKVPITSGVDSEDDDMSNKENQYVIQKPSWSTTEIKNSTQGSPSIVKPLVSARLGHRKNVKNSPEAGGRTVLGVSKQRKNETLESTWRSITEGRAIPLTRHLRKSDSHHAHALQETTPKKKAERTNYVGSPSPARQRREASLSQDELNRRVEAFIKKFNEEMRLQRQESLNQYTEMIKRVGRQP